MNLKTALAKNPVIYVARDAERAIGLPPIPGFFIIANYSAFAKRQNAVRRDMTLIKSDRLLNAAELLSRPETAELFQKTKGKASFLVFKNTEFIEKICAEKNWRLINPSAKLAAQVEEKISQIEWLGDLRKFLPPHDVYILEKIKWRGEKFFLQFNRSHTGEGTFLIENEKQLEILRKKFPKRPARVVKPIGGPVFTSNIVAAKNILIAGNTSYQITGLAPFTDRQFATVGNDWSLPRKILSEKQKKEYNGMIKKIGKKMLFSGWRGLFGIDAILDQETGHFFLLEINARQPASTTCETILQLAKNPREENTVFAKHILALLQLPMTEDLTEIKTGGQLVQRVTAENISEKTAKNLADRLEKNGFSIFLYDNTDIGDDLIRVRSKNGLMLGHNIPGEAKKIIKIISKS